MIYDTDIKSEYGVRIIDERIGRNDQTARDYFCVCRSRTDLGLQLLCHIQGAAAPPPHFSLHFYRGYTAREAVQIKQVQDSAYIYFSCCLAIFI